MNTPSTTFLAPQHIQSSCTYAGLDVPITQAFLDFAARVRANPELTAQAIAAHDCLFEGLGECDEITAKAEAMFGDEAHLLRGLMVVESIRRVRERHAARGVSAQITQATLDHHPCSTLRDYAARNGHAGADSWIWSWYRTVGSGHLYRLGRLEFFHEAWDYDHFRVFANVDTGEIVAMLNANWHMTHDGYQDGTAWTSTLVETEEAIIGHPISPLGYALNKPVRLLRKHWQQVLGPGIIVLDVHIPGGEPLTLESLRAAMLQAETFFDHYYPGPPFVAFVCDSWLFSTQLEGMLGESSNIVRWQREGYLYPSGVGQEDFMNFIFGTPSIDINTAPRDTRLRRAIVEWLQRGEILRGGGYFLLRRDLPRFGSQPYH